MAGSVTQEVALPAAVPSPHERPGRGIGKPVGMAGRDHFALWVGLVVLAALVLRLLTVGHFRTADESLWLARSERFTHALLGGDLRSASASVGELSTMPGVTTMWIGSAARLVWLAGFHLGAWPSPSGPSADWLHDPAALAVAQVSMAVVVSAVIGVLTVLVARWAGRRAAVIAGAMVATEPFLVAHGSVLHTDELMALTGVAAVVATALALGVPRRTEWAGRRRVAVAAGGLWGLSLLTKVSALMFLPCVAVLGVWHLASGARPTGSRRSAVRALVPVAGAWALAAVVVILVAYPALWVAPAAEVRLLRRSAGIAGSGHTQFFLGRITRTPGPAFYLVALPLRMTPWFLLGSVVAAASVARRPHLRPVGLAVAAVSAPVLVVLSLAPQQFDRYGLALLVFLAVIVGVGLDALLDRVGRGWRPRLLGAALLGMTVASATVAPWGLAYFDPVLGGSRVAPRAVLVGWGEGQEKAGPSIERLRHGRCDGVTVSGVWLYPRRPCERPAPPGVEPTYVVVYVNQRQRTGRAALAARVAGRELEAVVRVRGMVYLQIYGPRRPVNG